MHIQNIPVSAAEFQECGISTVATDVYDHSLPFEKNTYINRKSLWCCSCGVLSGIIQTCLCVKLH